MANRFALTMVAATAALTAVAAPASATGRLLYNSSAEQMITVVAGSPAATTASLATWRRVGTSWELVYGPVQAFVGKQGIGKASESSSHTPAGVWNLTEAFGIQANNGTGLPYRQVTTSDWWVSDVTSRYYNTHYVCAPGTCPFNEAAGEDLGKVGTAYNHAVVIDYNRFPAVPGNGSAFFLHVSTGNPTAGCVSIPAADLDTVMRWLDPAKHPVINISVQS